MAMTRGASLVSSLREVSQLTGQVTKGLASADLSLGDILISASDAVYDRLEGDGIDPTTLESDPFKRVVAWHFLGILAMSGALRTAAEDPESVSSRYFGLADKYYAEAPTRTSSADDPRRAGEGIPSLANFEGGWVFQGGADPRRDHTIDRIPDRRT